MRLLLTGGAGFCGRYIARAAIARGDDVILYDLHEPAGIAPESFTFVRGDLGDVDELLALLEKHQPNTILHLAAVVGVPASLELPIESTRVNIESTMRLLEASARFGRARVIHLSSEETYGDFESTFINEDHAQRPATAYGISKLAAEGFCRSYRAYRGVDVVNVRTSWVYGAGLPRMRPPGSLLEPAARGEAVHYPFGADFIADYTSVYDVADGMLNFADAPSLTQLSYNLSSGEATVSRDLIEVIKRLVPGADISMGAGPWHFAAGCPAPRKGALDNARAFAETGYRPKFDLTRGLERYLSDLRSAAIF